MRLTYKNYHTKENKYLTGSKIKDFQKCKNYFYHLHISNDRIKKEKDAWNIGKAVDTWLTRGKNKFLKEYVAVSRRSLKNLPKGIIELTMSQYEDVVRMCETLENQPAYLELKDHEAQKIITLDMPIGEHFIGLAFMMDWFKITENGTAIITDLKTSVSTDELRWHYKCKDFGYYMQFAVATVIIRKTMPEVKRFEYRHLVIEKGEEINIPHTFEISNETVELYVDLLLEHIIPAISKEKEYKQKIVTWESCPVIGEINQDY